MSSPIRFLPTGLHSTYVRRLELVLRAGFVPALRKNPIAMNLMKDGLFHIEIAPSMLIAPLIVLSVRSNRRFKDTIFTGSVDKVVQSAEMDLVITNSIVTEECKVDVMVDQTTTSRIRTEVHQRRETYFPNLIHQPDHRDRRKNFI